MTTKATPSARQEPAPRRLPTRRERSEAGRALRDVVPLTAHTDVGGDGSRDPMVCLRAQDADRLAELVPIRWGRMSVNPFTFYRGAAALMANDLALAAHTGLNVQLCGDAHVSNFGVFAAPDRRLVFDLNDFDETTPGPFEWDVKRLAASVVVAGRNAGFDKKQCAAAAHASVSSYRTTLAGAAELDPLDVWYSRVEVDQLGQANATGGGVKGAAKQLNSVKAAAGRKNRLGALAKLTEDVDGRRRIRNRPPLIRRFEPAELDDEMDRVRAFFARYLESLAHDRRHLLSSYTVTDLAVKVVGVGSVGTRCLVAMLESGDGEPIFLQLKEAGPSALEPIAVDRAPGHHGRRVVEGQQILQSSPDVFLGWSHFETASGTTRDFYVRQLWDGKASAVVEDMAPKVLTRYATLCGALLARAHARSGDANAISGYLGNDDTFDRAVTTFAVDYARRNKNDHASVLAAITSGDLPVIADI
jgi:uncharacterized protein (DUF2252 family)